MNLPERSHPLIEALNEGPCLTGLVSLDGELLLFSGALKCLGTLNSSVTHNIKHLLPFRSAPDNFWQQKLYGVSNERKIDQFERAFNNTKLLITLFPSTSRDNDQELLVGIVILEICISDEHVDAQRPTRSTTRLMFPFSLGHP
jgi:hypothetical protein